MSSKTDKALEVISDADELQKYAQAQYQTILAQSKKITELERAKTTLEEKVMELEKNQTINAAMNIGGAKDMSDEETICVVQLALLRNKSMNGELTAEECKKTETYVKTLNIIRGKQPTEAKKTVEKMDTAALLQAVDDALEQ